MEGRMTICNMSIEWGAKAGMIAPDQTTFDYIEGRPDAPKGAEWDAAVDHWMSLRTDDDASLRQGGRARRLDDDAVRHLGDQPGPGRAARRRRCRTRRRSRRRRPDRAEKALEYMALRPVRRCARSPWTPSSSAPAPTDASRTCASPPRSSRATGRQGHPHARRAGLGARAHAGRGRGPRHRLQGGRWRVARRRMLDVPGHEPRPAHPGERSASTSNRNFEGRQGKGGRTHLVSRPSPPQRPSRNALARRPTSTGAHRHEGVPMDKFTTHTGVGVPLRRSNVDTDQIIPAVYLKRVTRTGFEDGLFAAWRDDPTFVLNQPEYAEGIGARRRSRLRHRLLARARRLGAAELRLPGGDLLALRRHLPRQRRQVRPRRRPGRREGRAAALGLPRVTTRRDGHRRPRSANRQGWWGSDASRTPSTSTTTPGGACSRDSTTSASRCRTTTTSRPSKAPALLEAASHNSLISRAFPRQKL